MHRDSPDAADEEGAPSCPKKRRARPRWLSRRGSSSSFTSAVSSLTADVTLRFSFGGGGGGSSQQDVSGDVVMQGSEPASPSAGESFVIARGQAPRTVAAVGGSFVGRENSSSFELARRNSITETKTVFMRSDMRSASFTASPGEAFAFTFDAHFDWMRKLGSGSFADVYAVRHKLRPDETYAVKILKKEMASRADRAAYLKEVELANSLPPHEHIVSYLRAWQDECILYVQMELCEGGTLREQMAARPLDVPSGDHVVWKLIRQVASALAHIHAAFLIHCDVKPDNVLLDGRGNYKVGDLGQATALTSWDEHEGDARYISEDLLHSNPSPAADIFSFGIMILEVKSGEALPGHGDAWKELRQGGAAPIERRLPSETVDPRFRRLVLAMMNQNAMERPDARAVEMACPQLVQAGTRSLGSRLLRAAVRLRGVSAFNMRSRAQRG